jgi:ATP-binding cassette subfamily C protein CydD
VRGPVHPWLWRHARATRLALAAAVALGLITTGLVVAQATLLAEVVARAFLGGAGPASLRPLLLGLALVALLRAGATWAAPVVGGLAAGRVKSAVRAALTARSLRLARSDDPHSGEIATLAAEGVDAFDAYLARYLPRLALGLLAPPLVIAWVLRIDPLSGVVLLLATPLVPVFMWLVGAGAQARARRRWRELTRLGVHFLEVMRGLSTLEIFGRGRAQRQAIRAVSERYRRATMGTLRLAFLSALVLELAAAVCTALVAVEVGLRLVAGQLGLEAGLTVLLLVPEVFLPLRLAGAEFHASAEATAVADRVRALLEGPAPSRPLPRTAVPGGGPTRVVLEGVTVVYPGRPRPVLDGVDLELRRGERMALVGPSGAGKSTLLAVLLGLQRPARGRVLVDGSDLRALDPESWWRQLGWLSQRPHLASGSIADNVRLGSPWLSDREVWEALERVGLADWVRRLPGRLDSPVGEEGRLLSGGQRSRLALARALARRPRLLLLDEPTAHLSGGDARLVTDLIRDLDGGTTAIFATHDRRLAADADRVLELAEGRLVEMPRALAAGRAR